MRKSICYNYIRMCRYNKKQGIEEKMKLSIRKICLRAVIGVLAIAGISMTPSDTLYAQNTNDAKIHYLILPGNTEAILLECNGMFGMVDSGEDNDYPTGEDERYPYRDGIIKGQGSEDQVIEYLRSLGVTTDNFEFYIGTHPHSDHIGSADEVIREFHPKRVYIQEYQDSYIRNPNKLWDNLYCYDHMIQAAKEVNACLIQNFDSGAPVCPETMEGEAVVGCDRFMLGEGMNIQICNYGDFYKYENAVDDANDFSLGVLVEANGKRVFLSGDINNSEEGRYAEMRLLEELGHVDILTLGHHGASGSNNYSYVYGLSPEIMVLSGNFGYVSGMLDNDGYTFFETLQIMSHRGIPLYATGWFVGEMDAMVFTLGDQITSNIPEDTRKIAYARYNGGTSVCYYNGLQKKYNGWLNSNGYVTYFNNSVYGLKNKKWLKDSNGNYHYFDGSGICKVGWLLDKGKYYYLGEDTIMQTGWQTIAGKEYYFYPTGELATGWQKNTDGNWLYYDSKGNSVTGWVKTGGKWYYLDEQGYMQTGWQVIGERDYYFHPAGDLAVGWRQKDDGNWLYYDSTGNAATGWLKTGGYWYYLDEQGHMLTGKQEIDGAIYYLAANGRMKTGWNLEDGVWFYYNANGSMRKGWLKDKGSWYYLDENGWMLTGKQEIDGVFYFLTISGKMLTGWNHEGNQWYYYNPSGAMCTSIWIRGQYYIKEDGTMAVSEWVDSDRYYVDQDGRWVPGKTK